MKKLLMSTLLVLCASYAQFSTADEFSISAKETYQRIQDKSQKVLFIDVRDPIEIQFTGYTDAVDINIPLMLVDRSQWDNDYPSFKMLPNNNFVAEVKQALAKRGLDDNTVIITMCRSGTGRGLPSVELLRASGLNNSFYVEHGFQGDVLTTGEHRGQRLVNGWQNSGLPWGGLPSAEKAYKAK